MVAHLIYHFQLYVVQLLLGLISTISNLAIFDRKPQLTRILSQSKNSWVENLVNRRVDLITDEYDAAGRFNEQASSPLFSVLPREIRGIIWQYATAPFEDQSQKFGENMYYY